MPQELHSPICFKLAVPAHLHGVSGNLGNKQIKSGRGVCCLNENDIQYFRKHTTSFNELYDYMPRTFGLSIIVDV